MTTDIPIWGQRSLFFSSWANKLPVRHSDDERASGSVARNVFHGIKLVKILGKSNSALNQGS